MINISKTASDKLHTIMAEKNITNHALRVFVSGGGCSGLSYGMTFAPAPEADDQVLSAEGLTVVIDPASMQYLMGAEIDYVDSMMGSGFRIDNPNAVQTCSCGSSSSSCGSSENSSCCN